MILCLLTSFFCLLYVLCFFFLGKYVFYVCSVFHLLFLAALSFFRQ